MSLSPAQAHAARLLIYLPLWEVECAEQDLKVADVLPLEVERLDVLDDHWSHCFTQPLTWVASLTGLCERPRPVRIHVDEIYAAYSSSRCTDRVELAAPSDPADDDQPCFCLPVDSVACAAAQDSDTALRGWVVVGTPVETLAQTA